MSRLLSAADRVHLGPPTMKFICPIGVFKERQLENGYIALTQLHVDRLRPNFTRWYSVAARKRRNFENPLRVESKMANDAHVFNIGLRTRYLWNG